MKKNKSKIKLESWNVIISNYYFSKRALDFDQI